MVKEQAYENNWFMSHCQSVNCHSGHIYNFKFNLGPAGNVNIRHIQSGTVINIPKGRQAIYAKFVLKK